MKWTFSHANDDIHHWQLQSEDSSHSLIFNPQRLSLRLLGKSRRLFFVEEVQGFLQKKVLLRNEYGIAVGESTLSDKLSSGYVLLDGQRLAYRAEGNRLLVFNSEKQLVSTCELLPQTARNKLEVYALLFGFGWLLTTDAVIGREAANPVPA